MRSNFDPDDTFAWRFTTPTLHGRRWLHALTVRALASQALNCPGFLPHPTRADRCDLCAAPRWAHTETSVDEVPTTL